MKLLKKLAISGLLAGSALTVDATVPNFSTWKGQSLVSSTFLLSGNFYKITQMTTMLDTFCKAKTINGNQKVMIGYQLPLIFLAASLNTTDYLEELLNNPKTLVAIETPLGNTPMHAAAINSSLCLEKLINDLRLNVNEDNYAGETPLYVAMKAGNDDSVDKLLNAAAIKINAVNLRKQNMLHVAVMQGQPAVISRIINLDSLKMDKISGKDPDLGKSPLDNVFDQIDSSGKSALDYVWEVESPSIRKEIVQILDDAGKIGIDVGQVPFGVPDVQKTSMEKAATDVGTYANAIVSTGLGDTQKIDDGKASIVEAQKQLVTAIGALAEGHDSTASNVENLQTINEQKEAIIKAIEEMRIALDNEPKGNYTQVLDVDIQLYKIRGALEGL